jgi:predicted kinase
MRKFILVDIDGTVADCQHRIHFIENHPKDHQRFYDELKNDAPIQHIIDLVNSLYENELYDIIFCTGRPETHRFETALWFLQNHVHYDLLYMRKEGDYRQDYIVKKEILEEIRAKHGEPSFVLDDRQSVVDMWRKNGVPCLQVAAGDFDKPKYNPGKLILLVGPSGAGKSSFAHRMGYTDDQIVSSDAIRQTLCGDFQDQSKNEQVFNALQSIVKTRIESGLLTIVDATNIRNADRKAFLKIVPSNTKIEYFVIDRPLEEKLKTGGRRLEVKIKGSGLIERHDQIFRSNLKDILAGDDDPRVIVKDYRKT